MQFDRLKRRDFLTLLAGAVAWPLGAGAQQPNKLPMIGMLGSSPAAFSQWLPALLRRLRELGWIENGTMGLEYRWTEGHSERYAQLAAELVRLKVDVIVALGSPAIVAAKRATALIPLVFPLASDPVGKFQDRGVRYTSRRLGWVYSVGLRRSVGRSQILLNVA